MTSPLHFTQGETCDASDYFLPGIKLFHIHSKRVMDTKKPPSDGNSSQPLLPPPKDSSVVYPPFDSASGHPVQQYQGSGASVLLPQGSVPVQTVVSIPQLVTIPQAVDTPLVNPLPDYLWYSIFTTLCCCLPLGLAALVYSITTRDANKFGHQQIASKNSRMARILNHISVAVGLILYVIFIAYVVFVLLTITINGH